MITVIAADDIRTNHTNLEEVESSLETAFTLQKSPPTNSEQEYLSFVETIKRLSGDVAVILDLGFRSSPSQWNCVALALRSLCSRWEGCTFTDSGAVTFPIDGYRGEIPQAALDGISLVDAVIENSDIKRCLIYIASGRGSLSDLQAFVQFANSKLAKLSPRQIILTRDTDGRDLVRPINALGILKSLQKEWYNWFPDFHTDPHVDKVLREWLAYFRSLDERTKQNPAKGNFCGHDHIEQMPEAYADILHRSLGIETESSGFADPNSLKAILMLSRLPSDPNWPTSGFTVWPADDARFSGTAKPIPSVMMSKVLSRLSCIEVDVADGYVKLPVMPGLPFLLALRVFISRLEIEGMLDASSRLKVAFDCVGTTLTIPLKQMGSAFGLGETWRSKDDKSADLLARGVCGNLWDVLRARVETKIKTGTDPREQKLLRLFEGLQRRIVGVHFAPHFVHLYWN